MRWLLYRVLRGGGLRQSITLALLVAVVGAVLLVSIAGARRTATAVERLTEAAGEIDLFVDASESDPVRRSAIASLPSVDRAFASAFVYAFPEDGSYQPMLTRTDPPGGTGDQLATGHVIEGRRPDPEAADEVALSEQAAREFGVGLGDVLRLATYTPDGAAEAERSEDVEPDGPPVELDVVGIVRSSQDLLARPGDPTVTVLPYGFFNRYQGEVAMVEGQFLVRLADEPGARRAFGRDLRQAFAGDEVPLVEGLGSTDALDQSMTVLVTALLAFALVVYLAGAATIGQAANRAAAAREPEQLPLAGIGLGRSGRWLDAWVPLALAGVGGVAAAAALAVALSGLLPIGLARRVDPDLGLSVDLVALTAGATAMLATVMALGAWSAWRTSRTTLGDVVRSGAPFGRWSGRLLRSTRPAVAVGVAMATSPGRGATAVPVRTAFSGMLLGVMGLVAALVFGAGVVRLLDTPSRYGWTWDVSVGRGADDPLTIADRPGTTAVASGVFNVTAEVEGVSLFVFSLDPVEGDVGPTMAEGQIPRGDREVALGSDTRRRLGNPSTVEVVDRGGTAHEFEVVGTVVIPSIEDPVPMAEGAYLPIEGLTRLGLDDPAEQNSSFRQTVVRFTDGTDPRSEVEGLGPDVDPSLPEPPQEVQRLEQVSGLPGVLAAFLATLGLLAVGQALWQTVRRRRREMAVLRTIGFDRGQVTRTFGWQAATLAVPATVVGLPLGVALGRTLWAAVADALGVAGDVAVPASIVFVLVAALVVPVVLGLGFGARAARRPAGADLHAE